LNTLLNHACEPATMPLTSKSCITGRTVPVGILTPITFHSFILASQR
jgi:hypothetical protein